MSDDVSAVDPEWDKMGGLGSSDGFTEAWIRE